LFIGTLVVVCIRQEVSLVTPDYYKEELEHGRKMSAMANARTLQAKPEILLSSSRVYIRYEGLDRIQSGELYIMRPGNQKLDHRFQFEATPSKEMAFVLKNYEPGLYRLQLKWVMDGKEFIVEEVSVQ
jgi:hypothetical protein